MVIELHYSRGIGVFDTVSLWDILLLGSLVSGINKSIHLDD